MASIQGVYLAIFGRPADPAGLAYWTQQSKNGADLGKVIDVMTKLPEATARFAGQSDSALITSIYQALFDRAPDAAGLAFFTQQLASGKQTIGSIAINILDGAKGSDLTLIQNRETAANVFTASLDTPAEIAAYNGTTAADFARSFIKTVTTDPTSVPTPAQVQTSINTGLPGASGGQAPGEGQTPPAGGGGGGGGGATTAGTFDSVNKTLTIANDTDAKLTVSGDTLTFTANNANALSVKAADLQKIVLSNGAVLHSSGETLNEAAQNLKSVAGSGKLDIQGVTFTNATPNADPKASFEPSASLDAIYGKVAAGTGFSVNGNEADTIKAIWDVLDDNYVRYDDLAVNTAFVNLGIRYVEFLESGGKPFTDLIAKATDNGARVQNMHDNLLGNLTKGALKDRFDDTTAKAFEARIPDAYESREYYDGAKANMTGPKHDAVRAFDYAKGWTRLDYIDQTSKTAIDASAIAPGNKLFVGSGNTATGFNVVRHEGAGIELALKAKVRGGTDYDPVEKDGFVQYDVAAGNAPAGPSWGPPAKWSFDFSVATGLNEQNKAKTLNDYTFKALVDIDRTDGVKYLTFEMQKGTASSPAVTPWVLVKEDGTLDMAGFADEELNAGTANAKISQNSVNFGFNFLETAIDGNPQTPEIDQYDFGKGTFDIKFVAYEAGTVKELASNHIQVLVDGGWPLNG
ncbi:DUF4214 domain-containing protein [Agrobacterium genomosp. 3]|uniref:DUF4214 domain-containing protein n=1 Tax=Agrobacterium tomkonis TaxID=1183410 RepID=UPI001CD882C1|nr:DUF4214 domain-containing protein [Agrobacterium tomkonis]MCA1879320.1 DUF4214 domain-containing protein [Agrobacterium tumefaciens]MCA1894483.1 DUF4214 domain-containing protein [Agrobacterium tomkonis]